MNELVKYDAMCRAIAEAYKLDEAKAIRDKAIALEAYARQVKNTEAENLCYQIRMRAQRRAGELSTQIEKAQGSRSDLTSSDGATKLTKQQTLANAGITKQQASDWERLSDVPEDQFEDAITSGDRPSVDTILPARQRSSFPDPTPEQRAAFDAWHDAFNVFEDLEKFLARTKDLDPKTVAANLKYEEEDEYDDDGEVVGVVAADEHAARKDALNRVEACIQWLTNFAEAIRQIIPAAAPAPDPSPAPAPAPAAALTMPDRKRAVIKRAHDLGLHDYAEEIQQSKYATAIRAAEKELDRREATR
jgi:hypothetical protein